MAADVDVAVVAAEETDKSGVKFFGELDGEAGGGGDGADDWDARDDGFLHDFETTAPTDHEYVLGKGEVFFEKSRPDHFIHGIMASDILTQVFEVSFYIKEGGGVKTSGFFEDRLFFSQLLG